MKRRRLTALASGLLMLLVQLASDVPPAWPSEPEIRFPGETSSPPSIADRLAELERQQSLLNEEQRSLAEKLQGTTAADEASPSEEETSSTSPASTSASKESKFKVSYDDGFAISPNDSEQYPFKLKFNNQAQFRYTGFARDVETWTDSAGNVSPVTNRSAFELTRGRAIVSGYAFAKELTYNLAIDYTTTSSTQLSFWNYWIAYEFNRGFSLFAGQTLVPGSREWLTPWLYTQGPDYSLATTFFRPSLSQGVWATGEPVDGLNYRVMLSNGFNTLGTNPRQLDTRMTLSGSVWLQPWGDYGAGFSDFEWHDDPAIRLGTSYTYSPIEGQQGNPDLPENVDIRLSDGTLITQTGALAPGVTLNQYSVSLNAIDAGWKYRGVSINAEVFLRDLLSLHGDGPVPQSSIFDYGGYLQGGVFAIPQRLELYGRTSRITGDFGRGSEYAGGMNWFLLCGKQNLKLNIDAAWINDSPADQLRSGYRAGDSGLLLRTQIQFYF